MKVLSNLYAALLRLYPCQFRAEFEVEMLEVFADSILDGNRLPFLLILRELRDLPGALYEQYAAKIIRGGIMSTRTDHITPATKGQALAGALPYLAFGIVMMIDNLAQPRIPQSLYLYLSFYLLSLGGLLIGWLRGFPLWSYSYLGWSLVFTWWWSTMSIGGEYWGTRILFTFGAALVFGLVLTRSLKQVKKFFGDIFRDWTRLSLALYAFIAFVALIYDENHHPYLFFFMAATTLVTAAGAWFFMRSTNFLGRVASVWVGFLASFVINLVCNNTWDYAAYYGLPEGPPDPWFMSIYRTVMILSVFSAILLWPAMIEGIQKSISNRQTG